MRRREFIAGLASAVAWPLTTAWAQRPDRIKRVGVLVGLSENDPAAQARVAAFLRGLEEFGWIEGHNVRFEIRWSGAQTDRLRASAAELVERAPDVILAQGTPATAILKQLTRSVPIVFAVVNDRVTQGFVSSLAHPGGNITGFSYIDFSLIGKSFELFKQLVPGMTRVAFMFNPETFPYYDAYLPSLEDQVRRLSLELIPSRVHSDAEIEATIAELAAIPGCGLMSAPDSFTNVHRATVIRMAALRRLPAVFSVRDAVPEGGLMFYGPSQTDIFRRSASYVDRILRGANPADLPVQAPTKFEFLINLITAKALGLTIPEGLLAIADEVIQ
jgi:putative ABC transport system substrate-binding protein